MTLTEYESLPDSEKKAYQSHRTCPECNKHLVRTKHSTGDLHTICVSCKMCPDCDDGE